MKGKKNFGKHGRPQGQGFRERISHAPAERKNISDISGQSKGKSFILSGIVDRVVQTGGPTIFYISDGTGILALKAFESPGERAFPEIEEGSAVTSTVKVEEFQGILEGNIQRIVKLSGDEETKFFETLKETERNRARITPPEFLIKSPILEKLRDRFIKAATEIRLAIIQNRPIIVRHHNDTDGYSAGFALEKSILPLIKKQHGGGKSEWEFYTRAPCAAPFYEIDDSIRDTSHSLSNVAKFSNKMPLVVITDNGSSPEDLLGIQQGKVHGMDFIVIDHHFSDEDVISEEVLEHINPFLVGEDGAKFSAGMLCTEFARFVNPDVENVAQIAAMAGLADRIDNPSAVNAYLDLSQKMGYSRDLLNDISTVIDFVSAKLRFMEAREYIEVLFGEPRDRQKSLVSLMAPYIRKLEAKGLEIAKSVAKIEKIGNVNVQFIEIESTFPGFGFYPKPGKCVGLVHDYAKEHKKLDSLVSVGVLGSAMTIRATDKANFSVHELISFLNEKIPEAFVEGGGHKNAGSITFIPLKRSEVLTLFKEFVKKR